MVLITPPHLVARVSLAVLLLSRTAWAQFEYYEYDPYNGMDYDHWDCNPGGKDVNSYDCRLCGIPSSWPANIICIANYTDFDFAPINLTATSASVNWATLTGFVVTNTTLANAVAPATKSNHIAAAADSEVYFAPSYFTGWGFGRVHAFFYGCSNGHGAAVDCNVTVTASLVNNSASHPQTWFNRTSHRVTTTLSYHATKATAAPMAVGNLSTLSENHYKVTPNWTLEKYAENYTFSAVQADGCTAMLHLDNLETSWWYPKALTA